MTDTVTLSIDQAEKLGLAVLEDNGFSSAHAGAIVAPPCIIAPVFALF